MKKIVLCLLAISLTVFLVACKVGDGTSPGNPSQTPDLSAISSREWVEAEQLPQNDAVLDWYEDAAAREIVRNALICSLDEIDGLWHCWLYLGAWEEGDSLSFGIDTTNGYTVVINHTAYAEDDGTNSAGAFYFTVASSTEPSFDLYVNQESEGMLVTRSDVTVKHTHP